ncbi:RNA-binding protein Nova-1-like [Diadema setosum]|uniref:RNA-binding protein Nova-1-like n=1 Tax=Diadema setosum TaxID=31175 RepID=UPI003B3B2873
MATAEFVTGPGTQPASHSVVPSIHSLTPILDINGLNGDACDSRKRPLEGESDTGMATKRTNLGPNSIGEEKYILKMLVPSTAAGSIIGKGGQTIAQLQRDTGTNVKLSKANDFYPGTQERIALITGSVEALNLVADFIIEKIKESPQLTPKAGIENLTSPERARQVKVVVPNSTAGLIIGKGGTMIKSIMEQSGSRVQISQKSDGITLSERVITISGEGDNNKKATSFIITKIQEDPQSGSCNNLSYATITGPVANANPTGSPFAEGVSPAVASNLAAAAAAAAAMGKPQVATTGQGLPTATALQHPMVGGGLTIPSMMVSPRVPTSISAPTHSTADTSVINTAMTNLAAYGYQGLSSIGSLPGSLGATSPLLGATAPIQSAPQMFSSGLLGSYQVGGTTISPSSKTTLSSPSPTSTAETPFSTNGSSAVGTLAIPGAAQEAIVPGLPMMPLGATIAGFPSMGGFAMTADPQKESILESEVPETLVGAILGKGGKTLVEFQNLTGAKIQISKKNEYVPGTRNRRVTITGPVTAAQNAHFLIMQRVAQEEQNRALKGTT